MKANTKKPFVKAMKIRADNPKYGGVSVENVSDAQGRMTYRGVSVDIYYVSKAGPDKGWRTGPKQIGTVYEFIGYTSLPAIVEAFKQVVDEHA